ncbi:hypothetical protein PIROE2DRAFT_5157 [Piromyces sp. E2]|nr:hypothetical protein PIROE2DRAFT_5157 [Piromyces sp. E2]|eukprot:OUM67408.1 hypothetical protein PIROE2DRAFT_5157 [Piromyces sp. E2]
MEINMNIVNLKQYDHKGFFKLYQDTYGDPDHEVKLIRITPTFNSEYAIYYMKNENVVSIGAVREKKIRIFTEIEKVPMIFGVVTLPEERKKGYAGEVIKSIIQKLNSNHYDLAIIGPDPKNPKLITYYHKFGFEPFNNRHLVPFYSLFKKNCNIRKGGLEDVKSINQLFNDYAKIFKIAQYRDESFTTYRIKETFISGGGELFIFSFKNNKNENNNNIGGNEYKDYAYILIKHGHIIECVNMLQLSNYGFTEPLEDEDVIVIQNTLKEKGFSELLSIDMVPIASARPVKKEKEEVKYEDVPFTLIRLLNPISFIQKYFKYLNWSTFFSTDYKTNFNLNVKVKDDIIGDCAFNVKRQNGHLTFSTNTDNVNEKEKINFLSVDKEITISELLQKLLHEFLDYKQNDSFLVNDQFYFSENW